MAPSLERTVMRGWLAPRTLETRCAGGAPGIAAARTQIRQHVDWVHIEATAKRHRGGATFPPSQGFRAIQAFL